MILTLGITVDSHELKVSQVNGFRFTAAGVQGLRVSGFRVREVSFWRYPKTPNPTPQSPKRNLATSPLSGHLSKQVELAAFHCATVPKVPVEMVYNCLKEESTLNPTPLNPVSAPT